MQSPIGLVPKHGGKTRLIFHLSYDFGPRWEQKSLNFHTPDEWCSVKYNDLDHAVKNSLDLLKLFQNSEIATGQLFFAKTDCSHAFRIVPTLPRQRKFLTMMAKDPITGERWYFIDLCLPFRASISCATFQMFSDSLKAIAEYKFNVMLTHPPKLTNYLDDILFIAIALGVCNEAVDIFLEICHRIGCPISMSKTERAMQLIIFLGILIDGHNLLLSIPEDKKVKAINLINMAINQRKVTIKLVQKLTGTLNFLHRAIVPGRIFTRGMYAKLKLMDKRGKPLKQHHHIWLSAEFVMDCHVWLYFLREAAINPRRLCRPFIDFKSSELTSETLAFYSDTSRNAKLGFRCTFKNRWISRAWNQQFIEDC